MKTLKNIILEKILISKNSNINNNIKTNKYILYLETIILFKISIYLWLR